MNCDCFYSTVIVVLGKPNSNGMRQKNTRTQCKQSIADIKAPLQFWVQAESPPTDGMSHSGILVWIGKRNAPVACISRKQKLIAASSTEAELVALKEAAESCLFVSGILNELGRDPEPAVIQQDNQAAIWMAQKGDGFSKKHMMVRLNWLKDHIKAENIYPYYTPTDKVIADCLTKPQSRKRFEEFVTWIYHRSPVSQ